MAHERGIVEVAQRTTVIKDATVVTVDRDDTIHYDAAVAIEDGRIAAVGPSRDIVARFPGRVKLFDIAADGRMLLGTENGRKGIRGLAPGETMDRDLSCLDSSRLRGISSDGTTIVGPTTLNGALIGGTFSVMTRYLRRWLPLSLWGMVFFVCVAIVLVTLPIAQGLYLHGGSVHDRIPESGRSG